MPNDTLSQETVLCLFLDAKIAQAEAELAQAERFHKTSPSPYTVGRAQWCGHKLAALKEARRDADSPGQLIQRFLKRKDEQWRNGRS